MLQAGKKKCWNLLGGGDTFDLKVQRMGDNCIQGEFVPVLDCGGEGVASVVCATAEALVLEAVVAS